MITPLLVEKLVWPMLDWGSAVCTAFGHVLLGTLCTLPPAHPDSGAE